MSVEISKYQSGNGFTIGRDFLTNQPKIIGKPNGSGNQNYEDYQVSKARIYGTHSPQFLSRGNWFEEFYKSGRVEVGHHDHYGSGNKPDGLRGTGLAARIEKAIKMYMREHGIEHPQVDTFVGSRIEVRMARDTHQAFRRVYGAQAA